MNLVCLLVFMSFDFGMLFGMLSGFETVAYPLLCPSTEGPSILCLE